MRRARPRLYAFPREVELEHVRDVAATPAELAALEAVIDAFGRTARTKKLRSDDLEVLVDAARAGAPGVRGMAVTRLAVLTHYFRPARDGFEALGGSPDPAVREFAVTACANTPPTFAERMVAAGLADADWRVRKAAARVAGAVPLAHGGFLVETRLADERDARVRVALELAVRFQRAVG